MSPDARASNEQDFQDYVKQFLFLKALTVSDMIYFTQLVYLHKGQEETFHEFEKIAMPIITRYNGKLLLRIRPDEESVIEKSIDAPYEIHLVEFRSEEDFKRFAIDEERKTFLHLKEKSVRTAWLMKGEKIG